MNKTVVCVNSFSKSLDIKFYNKFDNSDVEIYTPMYGIDDNPYQTVLSKFINYNIIIVLNDSLMINALCGGGKLNPSVSNFVNYFKDMPSNTKYIYLDNNGEVGNPIDYDILVEWLNLPNKLNYLISSRFASISNERSIAGLIYLPILYMFNKQKFSQFPMLEYSTPSNPKYNFITYLGLSHKKNRISERFEFIKLIFDNKLDDVKYDDADFEASFDVFGEGKVGHYWNILNSLSAKIQIVFETYPFRDSNEMNDSYNNGYFFTEKIMKCFILPHPYVLIVHEKWLNMLEGFGFKFPSEIKSSSKVGFIQVIKNIQSDINGWIDRTKSYFEHNQKQLYAMVNSDNLPHHQFLNKIIKNEI